MLCSYNRIVESSIREFFSNDNEGILRLERSREISEIEWQLENEIIKTELKMNGELLKFKVSILQGLFRANRLLLTRTYTK